MKTDLFQSCGHSWVFHIGCHIECSTFTASSFRIWSSSTGIPSPSLALFIVMLPKGHLTSHSRMSGSWWVITPLWLFGLWRSSLYSSSVYSCHLFLLSSESEELKSLLMKVKEESEKVHLKLNTQKTKIMASCPITSWQIDGETVETVADFIFWGFKITEDGDCSHEIKRHLLLGRKVMTKLDSILKTRDITLSTKVCLVKAMVFPVVMYGCESWTIKKAEHRRIDAFELWCWRGPLRVPWTARRSNQSILKEISPGCSLEGLMLNLKLQYFGHLMGKANSFEKTLMLGKIEGRRRRGLQRVQWLDGITDSIDMSLGELWDLVVDREAWHVAIHGVTKSQTRLRDWTELNWRHSQKTQEWVPNCWNDPPTH